MKKDVRFPVYFRVPAWCRAVEVQINDEPRSEPKPMSGFGRIERSWRDGDQVFIRLHMKLELRHWPTQKDSVSVTLGPLTFALKLDEQARKVRDDDPWPAWELPVADRWNYGLKVSDPEKMPWNGMVLNNAPTPDQPFDVGKAPIELRLMGRRIPGWQADYLGLVGKLQQSPARTTEPLESITLVPMGCARLRISQFPTVSDSPDAHEWTPPPMPKKSTPASASHCWQEDTLTALDDGFEPRDSNDYNIPRFTWWPRRGTAEWVQYDFEKPRKVARVAVYWFDDSGRGRCRTPASWRLLYKPIGAAGGAEWREVVTRDSYATERDRWNEASFDTVETTALRIEVQLKPEFSGGILEWRVE
jgi:hypothetical protein